MDRLIIFVGVRAEHVNTPVLETYQAAGVFVQCLTSVTWLSCFLSIQFRNVVDFSDEGFVSDFKLLVWTFAFDEYLNTLWDVLSAIDRLLIVDHRKLPKSESEVIVMIT